MRAVQASTEDNAHSHSYSTIDVQLSGSVNGAHHKTLESDNVLNYSNDGLYYVLVNSMNSNYFAATVRIIISRV